MLCQSLSVCETLEAPQGLYAGPGARLPWAGQPRVPKKRDVREPPSFQGREKYFLLIFPFIDPCASVPIQSSPPGGATPATSCSCAGLCPARTAGCWTGPRFRCAAPSRFAPKWRGTPRQCRDRTAAPHSAPPPGVRRRWTGRRDRGGPRSWRRRCRLWQIYGPPEELGQVGDPSSGAADTLDTTNPTVGQHPSHVYATAGAYDATLTVTDSSGRTSTMLQQIEVAAN